MADNYPTTVLHKPTVNPCPLDIERPVALHPNVVFTVAGLTPLDAAERLWQLGRPVYYQKYRCRARVLYPPAGLPVGLVTALLGVPFFVYLLRRT